MVMEVRPSASAAESRASCTTFSDSASRAEVASSSMRMGGFLTRVLNCNRRFGELEVNLSQLKVNWTQKYIWFTKLSAAVSSSVPDEDPRDRHPLLLAAGELRALGADAGLVTL